MKASRLFSCVFRRDWSTSVSAYNVRQQNFGFAASEAQKVRQNASLISTAAQYNVSLATALVRYFKRFYCNVVSTGRIHFEATNVLEAAEFFHDRPALRVQMSDIPSTLDSGLAKVVIKPFNYTDKETGKSKGMCHQSQFP